MLEREADAAEGGRGLKRDVAAGDIIVAADAGLVKDAEVGVGVEDVDENALLPEAFFAVSSSSSLSLSERLIPNCWTRDSR